VQLGADLCFNSAAWRIAESHNRYAPTYAYRYDYSPRPLRWLGLGATHTTDLLPLFDVYRMRWGAALTAFGDRGRARRVSDDMQAHWVNFAARGEPMPDWPAYEPADRSVLVIDHPPYIAHDPHRDRRIAWEGFALKR
jgi:para-nitrobenzyl esterase